MAGFHEVFLMEGFDGNGNVKSQMVPLSGIRYVALRGGDGFTVTSASPALVTVTEISPALLPGGQHRPAPAVSGDRIFKLVGQAHGTTDIVARAGSGNSVQLKVDVKNRKLVRISYHFVSDDAGHHTQRPQADVREWLDMINAVYNPQANIFFETHLVRDLPVSGDLGPQVDATAAELDRVSGAQNRDRGADVDFYMVWELEYASHPNVDELEAAMNRDTGACVIEDNTHGIDGMTMAHELGHYLGVRDHYDASRAYELMYGYTNRTGCFLPRLHINRMNP